MEEIPLSFSTGKTKHSCGFLPCLCPCNAQKNLLFTDFLDFKTFTKNQAMEFKEYLATHKNQSTGETISKSFFKICHAFKVFFG
jgi:hypothetical protein